MISIDNAPDPQPTATITRHRRSLPRKASIALWVCLALAHLDAGAAAARPDEDVMLNFTNAQISAVAYAMAEILQRRIVIDPKVTGTITLRSERPMSPEQAQQQFLAALRLSGFTMVAEDGLYKIVPEANAKNQGTRVIAPGAATSGNGEVVTQIFRLQYESANALMPVLRPLISPNNTINTGPGNDSLIVTDYASNLTRLARIIATLDVPSAANVEVIPLHNAVAEDVAPILQKLVGAATSGADMHANPGSVPAGGVSAIAILADKRNNTLLLRAANPAQIALARSFAAKLDVPPQAGSPAAGNMHVLYLRNADAITMAPLLRAALANSAEAAQDTGTGTGTQTQGSAPLNGSTSLPPGDSSTGSSLSSASIFGSATAATSTGGQIQADAATNSLIITAPEPVYRQLRSVIAQLDERRAQVYVEALIAEVSSDAGSDLGVQWLLAGAGRRGGVVGASNFGSNGNIVDLAAGIYNEDAAGISSSIAEGFTLGLYKGSVAVLANALESRANANILSTPTITTLDNQPAKILIGQNIPIATGSYSNTGSSTTVTPFTTFDRQDVGLTLDIRPQINSDGTVKMQIYQEVSSIAGALGSSSTSTDASNIITNKRTINTTVLVQDGDTIVLGGLMQDETNRSDSKVPGLSRIPLLGSLFRSRSNTKSKTNLMIFLRPVVIRNADSATALSLDRYDQIRAVQQQSVTTDDSGSPPIVLPALPRPAAAAARPSSAAPPPTPEAAGSGTAAGSGAATPPQAPFVFAVGNPQPPLQVGETHSRQASSGANLASWVVQVAAMSSQAKADALVDKLRANGFDGYVDTANVGGKMIWRVRADPQTRREQAMRIREQIRSRLGITGNVVSAL